MTDVRGLGYDPATMTKLAKERDRLKALNAELVEALDKLEYRAFAVSKFIETEGQKMLLDACDKARAAIAKAKGD